jgi:hypothetical protein
MATGPLDLVVRIAQILDELDIPYALGGSLASSLFGEPRSTVDVDLAIRLTPDQGDALLNRTSAEFYVPIGLARDAIRARSSFNVVDTEHGLKIDFFVLGDGLLDRRQIDRRVSVAIPSARAGIWVTAPSDQILRKLEWYRSGGSVSDRQWRDVVGIIRSVRGNLDIADLQDAARALGLIDLLSEALRQGS